MNTNTQIDATITLDGTDFHGHHTIQVTGTNWRQWNDLHLACDMTRNDVGAMHASTCTIKECECGGMLLPEPTSPNARMARESTWIVPLEWVNEDNTESADLLALVEDMSQQLADAERRERK